MVICGMSVMEYHFFFKFLETFLQQGGSREAGDEGRKVLVLSRSGFYM